ncbi:hypothetical protein [Streptomyces sp. NPDC046862]|uniref:hypothetical protein n=1 Tax=Streptomyces sp. NPDC046862 TaxID=3154603 RepID=UPI003452A5D6
MIPALDGSSVDFSAYIDVVNLPAPAPAWPAVTLSTRSAHGLALCAVLMTIGWWRARRLDATPSATALALLCVSRFVSRRLGAVAVVATGAMAASRLRGVARYPRDVAARAVVGVLTALLAIPAPRRRAEGMALRLGSTRLLPLSAVAS